jgi:septal ring factor EnvC (AmiA/AmiB activator)
MFDSDTGRPVSAVHQGKVLFAEWLKGMGLVIVLDHGDRYMSLYGHNQALLKQAGDVVESGETISLVGQSGGQQNPGLYFELRHKGQAINPTNWLDL